MYQARINVTLRSSILDPQGKATHRALTTLGFDGVGDIRVGKFIEMNIEAESPDLAESIARSACEKLLANPVMEDFNIEITESRS
jgi:phosphoribosylformylglycinamidine synthase subunit PurS